MYYSQIPRSSESLPRVDIHPGSDSRAHVCVHLCRAGRRHRLALLRAHAACRERCLAQTETKRPCCLIRAHEIVTYRLQGSSSSSSIFLTQLGGTPSPRPHPHSRSCRPCQVTKIRAPQSKFAVHDHTQQAQITPPPAPKFVPTPDRSYWSNINVFVSS